MCKNQNYTYHYLLMVNIVRDQFFGSSQNQSSHGSWDLPKTSLAPVETLFLRRLLAYLYSKFCEVLTPQCPESQCAAVRAEGAMMEATE